MGHPGKGTSHFSVLIFRVHRMLWHCSKPVDGLKENTKEAWKGGLKCSLFCVEVGRAVSERRHSCTVHKAIKVVARETGKHCI